jgi:hypothetical protein
MMSSPLTGAMMKASKTTRHIKKMRAIEGDIEHCPDSTRIPIPPQEETDSVSALLHCIADHRSHESARFVYRDMGEDDYMDERDLYRVVEDLQFGHDLRM